MNHGTNTNETGELTLAIVTPSYRFDYELCSDLVETVRRYTAGNVTHHIIVPGRDLRMFETLGGPRTHVEHAARYLPRGFMKVPRANVWVNARRPYPPVRGWIAQQIIKLAAAAAMTTDVVLVVDSDIALVRHIEAATFAPNGVVELFRMPNGIDSSLPRHRLWHDAARRLLGLPATPAGMLTDYICCPCGWSPAIVRQMLTRIERVTGTSWQTAVASELHFSEMILYGVFVDEIVKGDSEYASTNDMRCVNHYDETPLGEEGLRRFLGGVRETDVAVMISAKSGTALDMRRRALKQHQEASAG